MIIFDRLQVSDSGKMLHIDIHVNKASYFDSVYISKVIIKTQNQVSESDPVSTADSNIYEQVVEGSVRELSLSLKAGIDLSVDTLTDKLLFVYVIAGGTPGIDTPCRLDEPVTLGVTFDKSILYQKVMQLTRNLADNCEIPKALIDMILLWYGFKSAIETEHYIPAIDFWNKLFGRQYKLSSIESFKGCGCNG